MSQQQGLRICNQVAGEIKDFVERAQEMNHGRVWSELVEALRDKANRDSLWHETYEDPEMKLGGGPGNGPMKKEQG
jgi:hypothetical protein